MGLKGKVLFEYVCWLSAGSPVGPLVARLEAMLLTDPLLIDTVEWWPWPIPRADEAARLRDCWLLKP